MTPKPRKETASFDKKELKVLINYLVQSTDKSEDEIIAEIHEYTGVNPSKIVDLMEKMDF